MPIDEAGEDAGIDAPGDKATNAEQPAPAQTDIPATATVQPATATATATTTAIETDTAATSTASTPPDDRAQLEALIRNAGNSKPQAFSDLFREWKREYQMPKHGNACDFAVTQGLSCLYRQGNLRSLAKLNRPAVMKLVDAQSNSAYVILTRIDGNRATLRAGDTTLEIASSTLDDYWLGEYTLLWQMPPYYQFAIQPGSKGPVVQWLGQQLARLYGQAGAPTIHDSYNAALVSQVKQFQSSVGLVADGVAGPNTLIQLNTRIGLDTPLLTGKQERN
jgi:general secretion pathway protein A